MRERHFKRIATAISLVGVSQATELNCRHAGLWFSKHLREFEVGRPVGLTTKDIPPR